MYPQKNPNTSREQFLEFAAQSGDRNLELLANDIINGNQHLAEDALYAIRDAGSAANVDFFKENDQRSPGVVSIANSKLIANRFFAVTAIQLVAVTAGAAVTPDDLPAQDFASIDAVPLLRSGELTITVANKKVLEDFTTEVFNTSGTNTREGLYVLDTPFMIYPEKKIEARLELPTGLPANTIVKLVLYGAGTVNS